MWRSHALSANKSNSFQDSEDYVCFIFLHIILKIIGFRSSDNSDRWNLKASSEDGICVLKIVTSNIIIITNEEKCFFSHPYTKMCSFLNTARPLADRKQQFHPFHHQILFSWWIPFRGDDWKEVVFVYGICYPINHQSYLQNQQCENNYSH